jgi:phosphopantetheinyl transferase
MKDANTSPLGRQVMARLGWISQWQAQMASSEAILNEEDKARANRFRFPEDKARFILGRRLLVECLNESLGREMRPLNLISNTHGRPVFLKNPEIQFNISHSSEAVCVTLTLKTKVGVDLEAISRPSDLKSLSKKIFSDFDFSAFQKFPEAEHPAVFFRAWTAKEAYLKALGLGIAGGLKEVSVPLDADSASPRLFHPRAQEGPWCLQRLPLPESYCGCVVWDDPSKSLDFRVLNPTA